MAKSSKSSRTARNERQKVVEQMRAQQKAAERRRGQAIVAMLRARRRRHHRGRGVAVRWWTTSAPRSTASKPLDRHRRAGVGAARRSTTKPATGNQEHLPDGSPVSYPDAPPAFGKHYITPTPMARKFYTAQDRPALGTLVHNEEHGYTILWYDDTVAKDSTQMDQIKAIADKFAGTTDLRDKFKAVPWTVGRRQALPRRPAHRLHPLVGRRHRRTPQPATAKQVGVWQYCSSVSGAALKTYMTDYPFSDSPEPNGVSASPRGPGSELEPRQGRPSVTRPL